MVGVDMGEMELLFQHILDLLLHLRSLQELIQNQVLQQIHKELISQVLLDPLVSMVVVEED
jgi:hypothetical protein|tara:strand:+ start:288 stop:470 length:183 start_codon:yes stop_codon:yes gene_type:complete